MNETTVSQLKQLGFNVVPVHLENITHKNGNTWAYTNRRASKTASVFGSTDVNCSLSIIKKGETIQASSDHIVTLWLNDCNDEMAQMYKEDFGVDALILLDADENGELITYKQANELLIPKDVPTSSDATSQQA